MLEHKAAFRIVKEEDPSVSGDFPRSYLGSILGELHLNPKGILSVYLVSVVRVHPTQFQPGLYVLYMISYNYKIICKLGHILFCIAWTS